MQIWWGKGYANIHGREGVMYTCVAERGHIAVYWGINYADKFQGSLTDKKEESWQRKKQVQRP